MDFGSKLEELNITTDELNRFSKAMKDEKFRELLHEYAQEISNPENKKKYEEELTQLEQERGNEVKFIHPIAHHVLKTSVNEKEKCFINICSNNLIDKPTCEAGRAENGQLGQCWSLPYSLTPGRPDRNSKGNKYMIYDVIFHPDTLDIADKDRRFMKLVNSTAVQGVENAFKVTLDKTNTILKKIRYKGVPQPAVLRKRIPGHTKSNDASPQDSVFNIPYPDTMPTENPKAHSPSLPQNKSLVHTQPHYTIKYRSFVDLQDYRCSRDSSPGSRPKEIIITIDLPLLASAAGIDLNVTDRTLTLQSQEPNYKLELHLSYPVNEDKGDAKFNKAKRQLIITLTVQPAKNYATENPPERDCNDDMGTADESDETVDAIRLVEEEQSEVRDLDAGCDQENRSVHEEDGEVECFEENVLESETDDWSEADATPTCEINKTGSRSSENAMDGPKSPGARAEKKILEPHTNNHDKEKIPGVETQMKPTTSHLDVHNHPTNLVTRNSEVESSFIRDEAKQTHSPSDTMKSLDGFKKISDLSQDQNGSSELNPSPRHLDEQVDKVDSSKQSKTDHSFSHPPILREKNPEDGSEVIITDHSTSAALSFQNSLWFELD
ncbi:Protein kintoun [Bagarius yarrelli]|uniref:Protein kintoun n=1 Tax=Bagarius yarrelli TaxID=175774 RepID=A0A556UFE0_BAGYA|nr:Protein kintoun [Bagarius yarrelli]